MDDPPATPSPATTDADVEPGADLAAARVLPVDLRDYVDCVSGEASRVRVFQTDNLALDVWCVEPSTATEVLHFPERDVVYTVIAGRSWFATDEGEVGLDPMGAILVPSDVVHGFENRSPDPLIVLASSSPPGAGRVDAPVARTAEAIHLDGPSNRSIRRVVESLLGTTRPSR